MNIPWSISAVARTDRIRARLQGLVISLIVVLVGLTTIAGASGKSRLPRVGILTVGTEVDRPTMGARSDLIRKALGRQGWIDGQTALLETRNAQGNTAGLAQFADELVREKVDIIWADSAPALRAAYTATRTIPIIGFDLTTDPVTVGYAQSFARPGGNVTGVFLDAPQFSGKWLELLRAVVPGLVDVAVVWDPFAGETHVKALQSIAPSLNLRLQVIEVKTPRDIDAAEAALRRGAQAVITLPSPMMYAEGARLARLTSKVRLPATSIFPSFVEVGGALAYGPDQDLLFERAAIMVSRVLSGAKAGELPIERPAKFDLAINISTMNALKLSVPDTLLAQADLVIR
jgi:putative tryptophan/tyrosine transport system substrate-binding protein